MDHRRTVVSAEEDSKYLRRERGGRRTEGKEEGEEKYWSSGE